MKNQAIIILAIVAIVLGGCTKQNPELRWKVKPDYAQNGDGIFGPRDQRYKPGGNETHPDNGLDNEGRSLGLVIFGPIASGGMGHVDSEASTEFNCGDGNKCTVKVRISSAIVGGTGKYDEKIKLGGVRYNSSGIPVDNSSTYTHRGNGGTEEYTLVFDGCGNVKITAEFEENITSSNPSGIQTKFSIRIISYSCS